MLSQYKYFTFTMMSNWRDVILKEFVPEVSKLTIVADPDNLLTEEVMALNLRQRGFDLIEFEDPIEFRFAYESQYRSIWDKGERTDLVVLLRHTTPSLEELPYDLLQAGRKLSFDLGSIFPKLSYRVLDYLDRSVLDELFEAQNRFPPKSRMGDNATIDFVLNHVYKISHDSITDDVKLLRTLLRLHYSNIELPAIVSDRLIQLLKQKHNFRNWPLESIIPDQEAFYHYLQERWPVFLNNMNLDKRAKSDTEPYQLFFDGPSNIPFDHEEVRIYIDNLFLEGKLQPVDVEIPSNQVDSWIQSGISNDQKGGIRERIKKLFAKIEKDQPEPDVSYTEWVAFSQKWAELSALVYSHEEEKTRLLQTGTMLNELFADWLAKNYSALFNQPPTKPAMLHHIPRKLSREINTGNAEKVALVVLDGLSIDQWVTLRNSLNNDLPNMKFQESAVFAWIPTLTSVSRQSLFAGKPPLFFPDSINTTSKDENHWKKYWEEFGFRKSEIHYKRGLSDGNAKEILDSEIDPKRTKALGLVINKVDDIMHGMQLGAEGMHNQVKQWYGQGFLTQLIQYLSEHSFQIWLTSDHGNVEAKGIGQVREGSIAEQRGERARVYSSQRTRENMSQKINGTITWKPEGLPDEYYPLFPEGYGAFVKEGENIIGHGGISMEEVLVPFVKIGEK